MPFVLTVISGPAGVGTGLPVPDDRAVSVGRHSGQVDFPIQLDQALSKRHFEIRGGEQDCLLVDLGSTGGTFVNGEQVARRTVRVGDEIRAGATRFRLDRLAAPAQQSAPAADRPPPAARPAPAAPTAATSPPARSTQPAAPIVPLAPDIAPAAGTTPAPAGTAPRDEGVGYRPISAQDLLAGETTDIADEARAALAPADTLPQFLAKLRAEPDRAVDAIRLTAHALPRRKAVWWACRCVRAEVPALSDQDLAALDAAEAWVRSGSEGDRRWAEKAAILLEHGTAAAWAANAAFWSGPTLAPDNVPAVPPAPDLGSRAVRGAVLLAAVAHAPEHAPERYARFLDLAEALAAARDPWNA